MPTLFDLPADPLPPDPGPTCGDERGLFAGAGQAFCIRCEWPAACEAEQVYREANPEKFVSLYRRGKRG